MVCGRRPDSNKFWNEVAVAFSQLMKQEEANALSQQVCKKYHDVLLTGEFLSSHDDDEAEVLIPIWTVNRNGSSLFL
jgi:hypothetical protein